jgi:hypothetical protein
VAFKLLDLKESFAVVCSLAGEGRFSRSFSIGGYFMASFGSAELFILESGMFMRWYIFRSQEAAVELFMEPALGIAAVIRGASSQGAYEGFVLGLSLGLRAYLGRFYIEPYIRAGYPFPMGVGVRFGGANRRLK